MTDDGYRFVECRDWGHGWRLPSTLVKNGAAPLEVRRTIAEEQYADWEPARGESLRTLVCMQCGSARFEWFNNRTSARYGSARYRYIKGYLVTGEGRKTRDEYRAIGVRAALQGLRGRR